MSASAGKVLLMPQGDYDNTKTYTTLDWVRYDNKVYVCKQTSIGNLPTNTAYWQFMVQDGTSPDTKMSYFDNGILGAHNIIKNNATSQTLEGVTYTVASDGTITANGTASANGSYLEVYSATLPAGSYTKSGCPQGGTVNTYHFAGTNTGDDTGSGATFTLNADTSCQFVIAIEPNTPVSNIEFKPMLRLATDLDDTYRAPVLTNKELSDGLKSLDSAKADKTELDESIGPVYAVNNNSVYTVTFDDLPDSDAYQLCMNDGIGSWKSVTKANGTNSGVKLIYTINSTYTNIINGQTNTVQAGSGGTPFYLREMK